MGGVGKAVGVVFLVLLFLGAGLAPAFAVNSKTTDIDITKAKNIAKYFIREISKLNNFKEWKKAEITMTAIIYNVDKEISAYLYEITVNGKYAGYIIVSAKRDNYPILEFSKGESPLKIAFKHRISVKKLYRINANTYVVEDINNNFYTMNGKTINFTKLKMYMKKITMEENVKKHLTLRKAEAERLWEVVENSLQLQPTQSYTCYDWQQTLIWGVPAFYWDDGCSPTAAAMVLEYYDESGYPNLGYPDWYYFEDSDVGDNNGYDNPPDEHKDLTEELHVAMGTSDETGATYPWKIDDGINKVVQQKGYSGSWASNDYYVDWSEVVNEVLEARPFVLSMTGGDQPYGDHSVTVVGYAHCPSQNLKLLILHDTWSLDDVYLTFGSWTAAMATWVRPQ